MNVAIAMVKDELDVIEANLRHLIAEGVDHIIVADNMSRDGTRDVLSDLTRELPLTVLDDGETAFYQATKTTALAHRAGAMGATWVLPFDADEMLYSPHGRLADVLTCDLDPVQWAVTFEHIPQLDDDEGDANPLRRIVHRKPAPKPLMKVVFRYDSAVSIWQGNHQVNHPGPFGGPGLLEIREFQYRSLEQAARKVRTGKAAYEATTLAATEGSHWREMGGWSDAELEVWWKEYQSQQVVLDPAPLRV